MAQCIDTHIMPNYTQMVNLSVQMIVVPCKGVFSIEATIILREQQGKISSQQLEKPQQRRCGFIALKCSIPTGGDERR